MGQWQQKLNPRKENYSSPGWKSKWVVYKKNGNYMYCRVCTETRKSNGMSKEAQYKNIQNTMLTLHVGLLGHKMAQGLASHAGVFRGARFSPLLNWKQHSFPMLSQSHCTFLILESWPWPKGNLIITWSARNTGKAFWPVRNVRFRAANRLSQISEYSMHS